MLKVWLAPLAEPADRDLAVLSRPERGRYAAISHPLRARAYATARLVLKQGLAGLTATDPAAWSFSPEGPPLVNGPLPGWRVGIAHSGGWVLCAVRHGAALGCDIEQRKPRRNLLALAGQYFSEEEQQALAAVQGEQQLDQFYRMWTAKEAYLKARHAGIAGGLGRFRLLPAAGVARAVEETGPWVLHSARWQDCQLSLCLPGSADQPLVSHRVELVDSGMRPLPDRPLAWETCAVTPGGAAPAG